MKFETTFGDQILELDLDRENNIAIINDESLDYSFQQQENGRYLLRVGTKLYKIDNVSHEKSMVEFTLDGQWHRADVKNEQDLLLDELGFKTAAELSEGKLNAPMPGKILEIMVSEGEEVELGDPVAILEAMKMENELKAPVTGVISSITAADGDSLEKNALILEIETSG